MLRSGSKFSEIHNSFFLLLFSPEALKTLRSKNVCPAFNSASCFAAPSTIAVFFEQPYRLRQSIGANKQIHLDPFACPLFIYR